MRHAWHLFPITAIVLMFGLTVPPVSVARGCVACMF
jgi:hypothetical protein